MADSKAPLQIRAAVSVLLGLASKVVARAHRETVREQGSPRPKQLLLGLEAGSRHAGDNGKRRDDAIISS